MTAAAPNLVDFMAPFGGLSDAYENVAAFCPIFAPRWEDFCRDFSAFLSVRFGGDPETRSLSQYLKDFHDLHPRYRLSGCVVQRPHFDRMGRVARDFDLQYLGPDTWYRQVLSPGKLAAMSDAAFRRHFETFVQEGLVLGGYLGVVWAMTQEDLASLIPSYPIELSADEASSIIYTLGLVDMDKVTRIIVFDYTRGDNENEPCPRTPTPIDGLSNALFWPVRPCARKGGQTRSVDGVLGRAEAVHGRALIRPSRWVASKVASA